MRDLIVTAVVVIVGVRALAARRPDLGLNLFTWMSLMNPHRLCWGFATTAPLAQISALATLGSLLLSKEPKRIPWNSTSILLILFLLWMLITTIFAINPEPAWRELNLVWKIWLMAFLVMIIATTPERIRTLMWVITLSLGFYGFKGGLFTLLTGGNARVWGPSNTFIGGNNEVGMALVMTIPLLRFLQLSVQDLRLRFGFTLLMLLCLICILGTHSRGALLGLAGMGLFLLFKSRRKLPLLLLFCIAIPAMTSFMPEKWHARMATIRTYEQDGSAMGRINAWYTAANLAAHRPTGGGYKCLHNPLTFDLYSPNPDSFHDAHSIYFEVLGEHGFVGLTLFLLIGITTWRRASRTIALSQKLPELKWIADLCSMIQVSLVGYFVNGAFLGLAMFDLYYDLIGVVIACAELTRRNLANEKAANPPKASLLRRRVGPVRAPDLRPALLDSLQDMLPAMPITAPGDSTPRSSNGRGGRWSS